MSTASQSVVLHTSPHLRHVPAVDEIMRNVVYALIPISAFAVYQFGISVLALLVTCVVTCLATEHAICRLSGRSSSVNDWSVTITGILLALTLPPGFPLWMAAVASIAGVGIGKMFFGGLGYNVMNPALVGRAFAQAAFTAPITTWTPVMADNRFTEFIPSTLTIPFLRPVPINDWLASVAPDGFTGATPLALMKFEQISTDSVQLAIGSTAGSAGETSALLILICGLYLVYRKMMDWKIAFAVLFVAALTSGLFYLIDSTQYPGPIFMLCSGGLMLGAVFMATDMVASPVTPLGIWIYGGMIGFLTIIIRLFGGLNEGVMYAILLANACSPLINSVTQPRKYGYVKKGAK
ncbi:RnfABCDGE type electron transport complex subunit D [Pelagicoccus mobilis]|uniref:Ion-translocating oxidoreductase complex subunit D n=1 Tax=Pelagicoccus mobilis TaxID=415221 RepID=A0A934VLA4_9BACT|nr:RnfABCDGE type electron transport complex subunit D [Pelagicoccus mobilis]MBK1877551.1 RnfABCDGE type electron transport complex subunit D [Pelagicoccus mobilis]